MPPNNVIAVFGYALGSDTTVRPSASFAGLLEGRISASCRAVTENRASTNDAQ
jgi:hypothetical protein